MGISLSLVLIAIGAIIAFAVNRQVSGLEVNTVGWIILLVGALGLLLSLAFWSSWGGFNGYRRRGTVVREDLVREDPY